LALFRNFKILSVKTIVNKLRDRSFYTLGRAARAAIIAFFAVALIAPASFVLIVPGDAQPLFPKVLKIEAKKTSSQTPIASHPVNGQMYLLTIYVTNPDSWVFGGQVLACWIKQDCVAYPRSILYQKNTSTKEEEETGVAEMKGSQSDALRAALSEVKLLEPTTNTSQITDKSVVVDIKDVGGPSGGLVFALGLTDLLTTKDLAQGRKIAGSGTIDSSGGVGAIGGISEKIIAARKAGASILFASQDNCDEIPQKVSGITVVAISKLHEAVDYLAKPIANTKNSSVNMRDFKGVIGCTNLGA
jgi:PDZ domain-containing protein